MSRRAPPSNPAADRAARNQQTIKGLLKLEANKSCADCKRNKRMLLTGSTGAMIAHATSRFFFLLEKERENADVVALPDPRWASWNLGIFVCIRYGDSVRKWRA